MKLIAASATPALPWKNGGGVTRELLRLPLPGGARDDWALRISLADIAAGGPFSPFPGVTRWFAVIAGAGVRLTWPGRAPLLVRRGAPPLRFDGADAPGCALLDGATRDLNVMVRADRGRTRMSAAAFEDEPTARRGAGFGFFALQSVNLHASGDGAVAMPALSLAWSDGAAAAHASWWIEQAADAAGSTAMRTPVADRDIAAPGYWICLGPATPA